MILFIELFLLYHIVFVSFPYIYKYTIIQKIATIGLFIMILPCSLRCFKKMSIGIKFLVISYITILVISAIINRNDLVMTNTLVGGTIYAITLFELFGVFSNVVEKRSIGFLVRIFLFFTFFYVFINDILIIMKPDIFANGYYFIGNKFSVAYKHLELIVLFFMNHEINISNKKKPKKILFNISIFILATITVMISYQVNTMTGVISVMILGIIILFFRDKLLYNPIFFVVILVSSSAFTMLSDMVLSWSPVQNFIVNILHRDLTLTGRLAIYANVPKLIQGHLLFGYGYNSAYEVWTNYVWYMPNAQNGLINCIFEQGLIATVILVLLVARIIFKSHKSLQMQKIYKPLIALLYVYAILGAIEITIDIAFVGWSVLLYTITLLPDKLVHKNNFRK